MESSSSCWWWWACCWSASVDTSSGASARATAAAAEDAAAVAGLEPDQRADRQAPEKVEQVLNSGIDFLSGLFEMATGKKLERSEETDSFVTVDRTTGEVTLKFKLPTFA